MIERIYIPTYRRTDKQLTYDNFPDHWRDKIYLVVAQDEYDILSENYQCLVCPVQGKPKEGQDPTKFGLSPTREWIAKHAGSIKYAVLDDDIESFLYTPRPSEKSEYPSSNCSIGMRKIREGFEGEFDKMMQQMSDLLDEYVTCSLEVTWCPPMEKDLNICWRQTTNHFYNGAILPVDDIDFTSLRCAQDYYILLQLLTMGYKNAVNLRYRVNVAATQTKGGCGEYRSLEVHNEAMRMLQEKFPDFVTLKEKVTKSGEWAGLTKVGANIQWKKAWESSQIATLEDLFG